MQRHRPVRVMGALPGIVTAAALLAAAGGALCVVALSDTSRDVASSSPAATDSQDILPFRESVSPHGASRYTAVVEQVGKVVSISDWTLTAASADGTVKTYVITPQTTTVTLVGSQNQRAKLQFSVDQVVLIIGTVENGTAVATLVADRAAANGNGPPMDG